MAIEVVGYNFVTVAGVPQYLPGPVLYTAEVPGPGLDPGESASIGFGFTITELGTPCGLINATVEVDSNHDVPELNEADNTSEEQIHIPGTQAVDIVRSLSPAFAPIDGFLLDFVPPSTPVVNAFNLPFPPGMSCPPYPPSSFSVWDVVLKPTPNTEFWVFLSPGMTPMTDPCVPAPHQISFVPVIPQIVDQPLTTEATYTYSITTHPCPVPCPGAPAFYTSTMSVKVTTITADGCHIAQRTLPLFSHHESQAP